MKKKLLVIIIGCALVLSLTGCGGTSYQEAENSIEKGETVSAAYGYFTVIKQWNDGLHTYQIVYANDTKVKYLIAWDTSNHQGSYGITPLYNADGTLQVYGKHTDNRI